MASLRITCSSMVRVRPYLAAYSSLVVASFLFAQLWISLSTTSISPQAFPVFFYQHAIGTLDGRSCSSYPVCSHYSQQATQHYGLLLGSWLSIDRLIHEADDLQRGPWIQVAHETRLNDPLERNAFWLHVR